MTRADDVPTTARLAASAAAAVRLARPQFLAGGVVLHGLGVAAAASLGLGVNVVVVLCGQVAVSATQLVTHFSNEAFDVEADRATRIHTPWSGGSRVLADATLPRSAALWLAGAAALVALAASVVLQQVLSTGPRTVPLVLSALVLAWSYSAPPARLHSRGLGEAAAAVLLAGLTPYVGYYLQGGVAVRPIAVLVAPLVCLQLAMLLVVSLPDAAGDRAVGKRTLAARYGVRTAARMAAVATGMAFALSAAGLFSGLPPIAAAAVWAWAPVAAWQAARLWRLSPERADWSSLGFWSIGLVMGPAAALLVAVAIRAQAAG